MGIIITLVIFSLLTLGFAVHAGMNRNRGAGITSGVLLLFTVFFWVFNSYVEVDTGHGGVTAAFGEVDTERPVLKEGLRWIKPWETIYKLSHQQLTLNRMAENDSAVLVQAKDNIPMVADVSFHWVLNYDAMGWVRQQYGEDYWSTLITPSAASAIRLAAGEYENWDDLMTKKRSEFQIGITEKFAEKVKSKMRTKGIPENVVSSAFDFPLVDLRKVLPVDESLTNEIALTKAAVQKGTRKVTEIANAALDARKRGQDGTAIRDTILRVLYPADSKGALPDSATMPSGTSLVEISRFIMAIAEIKRADAVELAAEKGNLTVMVTGSSPIALSPGK